MSQDPTAISGFAARCAAYLFTGFLLLTAVAGCEREEQAAQREVVVYAALDRAFSEPILVKFEKQTGIKANVVYDTESTKTVGLVNRIRSEKNRPRCDVFWNNEILNTLLLQEAGLLRAVHPPNAESYPAAVKDPEGLWHGFAARARVVLVNTSLVAEDELPDGMEDFLNPKWKGQIGIAKPVAGTTATHAACLFELLGEEAAKAYFNGLRENNVRIESGNKSCARNVADGVLAMAWTDTDDAIIEVDAGHPVQIVYMDAAKDDVGTLFIPNTLAAIKDSPNPAEADELIDFLLSAEVEGMLAKAASAQIPLNPQTKVQARVKGPGDVKAMDVDFEKAAERWESAQSFISNEFLK